MEEGALRVDANVSIHEPNQPIGIRTEIKNIGSIRGVAGAIRHEISRQVALVSSGGVVHNHTRSWDAAAGTTVPMRDKETVQDYRYMPEPNLPPLRVNLDTNNDTQDVISVPLIQDRIPELPQETRHKLVQEHKLKPEIAIQLVNEPILLEYFQQLITDIPDNKTKIANLLLNDVLTVLNKRKINLEDCKISVQQIKELVECVLHKQINLDVCKMVLNELLASNSDISPVKLIRDKGWFLTTDETEIVNLCTEVINNNPKLVEQYKEGKVKLLKALLGLLAKSAKSKIDMSIASEKLQKMLKK